MFCREYLIDLNATRTTIQAGYRAKTANRTTSENLSKPDIQSRIAELKSKRNEVVAIDADYVLRGLVDIDQMDVIDILNDYDSMFNEGLAEKLAKERKCWKASPE